MLLRVYINPFLLLLFFIGSALSVKAQYADKKYYLVDSLNIRELSPNDKKQADSLLEIYHSAKTDSVKLRALFSLTFLESEVWLRYNRKLLNEIGQLNNKSKKTVGTKFLNKMLGRALYNLSYYYAELNQEDSSYAYSLKCIDPFKKGGDNSGLVDAYNAIGNSLHKRGKIEESIKYYQLSQATSESINDKGGIAFAYLSVGHVYRGINEFKKAIEKYQAALKIFNEIMDGESVADSWNYLGVVYKWSGDTLKSEEAYKSSLKKSLELDYKYGIATARLNIGIDLQDKKQYSKAIENYKQSMADYLELNNPNPIAYCLTNMAMSYLALGKYTEALQNAKEALELSKQIGYPETILTSSDVLQKTFRKLNRFEEAIETLDVYHKMKDSIQNVETQKKALKAQLEYENEKTVLELNKIQENKNILAAEDKKRLNLIIWSVVIVLVLVSIFSVFLYRSLRKNKHANKIITMQKHVVEEKQKEILDSIQYAKRIQQSLLPTEKYIERNVKKLKDK